MGVSIHYRGFFKDSSTAEVCVEFLCQYAADQEWKYQEFNEEKTLFHSYEDDEGNLHEWEVNGPVKTLVISCHPNCEPLIFEFGQDFFFSDFVKTQFAPLEIHIAIIHLLRSIRVFTNDLAVLDEGHYWDTEDADELSSNINFCMAQIGQQLKENPSITGPVRLSNGRIVDLIEK
jgi:hypothetical protein